MVFDGQHTSGFESRPATVVPAGSNRSGSRRKRDGLKHSGQKDRLGRFSERAGRNVQ